MRSIQQAQNASVIRGSSGIGVPVNAAQPPTQADFKNELDAARAANWMRPDGKTWWPPNNGAVLNSEQSVTLHAGTVVGRIGGDRGTYVAPPGTAPAQLSLRPGTDTSNYHEYEVIKDIPGVEQATVAEWFNQPGGGTQYKLPDSIANLVLQGYIQMRK